MEFFDRHLDGIAEVVARSRASWLSFRELAEQQRQQGSL